MKPTPSQKSKRAILLIVCQDRPGVVSSISNFVFQHRGNIVDSDQHTDLETNIFFMRIEWELENFKLSRKELQKKIETIAKKFQMEWKLFFKDVPGRLAIFVSKYEHCLYDLLVRYRAKEIEAEIPLIVSNHPDLKKVAEHFKIPFYEIPIRSDHKLEDERKQIRLLQKNKIDLIVLARYMQVLSADFVNCYPNQIINIHHSFLPAFIGAKPYHRAYARGVKIIGATSHYVTDEVDEGPIIEQCVSRVSHRDRIEDLIRKGRDQEKVALAYAVRMHLEHRILTYGNKTVVFE